MLRYLIGRDQMLAVLRQFAYPSRKLEGLTGGSVCRFVSTSDFVQTAEKVSGGGLHWLFDFYLNQPSLPKLVSEIREDKLYLRWETPNGYAFPMLVEIEVNGQTERIEMLDGRAELSAACYAKGRLDPQMWILKDSRLIEIESFPRFK